MLALNFLKEKGHKEKLAYLIFLSRVEVISTQLKVRMRTLTQLKLRLFRAFLLIEYFFRVRVPST